MLQRQRRRLAHPPVPYSYHVFELRGYRRHSTNLPAGWSLLCTWKSLVPQTAEVHCLVGLSLGIRGGCWKYEIPILLVHLHRKSKYPFSILVVGFLPTVKSNHQLVSRTSE